jgi:hypothetical protein
VPRGLDSERERDSDSSNDDVAGKFYVDLQRVCCSSKVSNWLFNKTEFMVIPISKNNHS